MHLLQEAEIQIRAGNLDKARNLTHASTRLIPNHTTAYRLLALIRESSKPQLAILYWHAFWKSGNPTLADYHSFLHLLIQQRDYTTTDPILTDALKLDPQNIETITLCARFALMTGDMAATIEFMKEALQIAPNDRKARLLWIQLLLHANNPELQQEGRDRIWKLVSEKEDAYSLTALLEFTRTRPLSVEDASKLIEAIQSHPLVQPWHLWETHQLQFEFFPANRETFLQQIIQSELDHTPAPIALLRWLNHIEAYPEVLEILEKINPLSHVECFHEYVRAMEYSGRADELITLLKEKRASVPLSETSYEFTLGNLLAGTKDNHLAPLHWQRARLHAEPAELWQMALYFEQKKKYSELIACMEKLRGHPNAFSKYFVTYYFRILQQEDKTFLMKKLMDEASAYFPDNIAIENNLIYLSILLQQDVNQTRREAKKLWSRYPSSLPILLTYALALKVSGDADMATGIMEGLSGLYLKGTLEERLSISYIMDKKLVTPLTQSEIRQLLPEELILFEEILSIAPDEQIP